MKPEDIKIGKTYNVRMYVSHYSKGIISCCTVIGYDEVDGIQCGEEYDICHDEIAAFSPITPENSVKNSEPAPKHDPCRLFRKGDKVKLVEWNGRKLWEDIPHLHRIYDENGTFTVRINELSGAKVAIIPDAYTECVYLACPACLELVTPGEEIEPWVIDEGDPHFWGIVKIAGKFPVMLPRDYYTREQAEAECERLNAEHRKEQSHE